MADPALHALKGARTPEAHLGAWVRALVAAGPLTAQVQGGAHEEHLLRSAVEMERVYEYQVVMELGVLEKVSDLYRILAAVLLNIGRRTFSRSQVCIGIYVLLESYCY